MAGTVCESPFQRLVDCLCSVSQILVRPGNGNGQCKIAAFIAMWLDECENANGRVQTVLLLTGSLARGFPLKADHDCQF